MDDYKAWEENVMKYLQKVKDLTCIVHDFEVQQILREDNSQAYLLVKVMTTTPMALPRSVCFESIKRLAIEEMEEIRQLDNKPCWINPLVDFLKNSKLPIDQKKARKIKYKASKYLMYETKIYNKLLSCLSSNAYTRPRLIMHWGSPWRDIWLSYWKESASRRMRRTVMQCNTY